MTTRQHAPEGRSRHGDGREVRTGSVARMKQRTSPPVPAVLHARDHSERQTRPPTRLALGFSDRGGITRELGHATGARRIRDEFSAVLLRMLLRSLAEAA